MCLAAGRIFGRRFGIRQRPRTSAPSTEYGGLLGLPFAKHYREPCRVVAARRKEASRTVACRPFVTFCLRSRLPFLGATLGSIERLFSTRGGSTLDFRFRGGSAWVLQQHGHTHLDGDGDEHG